jgi:hypothetical protein
MNGLTSRHKITEFQNNSGLVITEASKLSLYSKITRFSDKKDQTTFEVANQGFLSVKTHIHNIQVFFFSQIKSTKN